MEDQDTREDTHGKVALALWRGTVEIERIREEVSSNSIGSTCFLLSGLGWQYLPKSGEGESFLNYLFSFSFFIIIIVIIIYFG